MDAAHEGARDGTAVGTSLVKPVMTGSSGQEKTGADVGGKFDEGDGAAAECVAVGIPLSGPTTAESRTVLSANASISSAEDCVTLAAEPVTNGSGEARSECAVAREPGPEDRDDELDPFLDDLVEQAPPRKREARRSAGESLGNQGLRHEQQQGVVHLVQA